MQLNFKEKCSFIYRLRGLKAEAKELWADTHDVYQHNGKTYYAMADNAGAWKVRIHGSPDDLVRGMMTKEEAEAYLAGYMRAMEAHY